jgi:hypothetical protein
VKNITYDTMTIDNVDYAIEVTQCYGQSNLTLCNEYPVCSLDRFHNSKTELTTNHQIQSSLTISDVLFTNIKGATSGDHDPEVGTIVCSSPDVF